MMALGKVWADPELPWEAFPDAQGIGQSCSPHCRYISADCLLQTPQVLVFVPLDLGGGLFHFVLGFSRPGLHSQLKFTVFLGEMYSSSTQTLFVQ